MTETGIQFTEGRKARAERAAQSIQDRLLSLAELTATELGTNTRGMVVSEVSMNAPGGNFEGIPLSHFHMIWTDAEGHCVIYEEPPGICRPC